MFFFFEKVIEQRLMNIMKLISFILMSSFFPAGISETDLARNKPTSQITDFDDHISERAIDGRPEADIPYCSHTIERLTGIPNWWFVDLRFRYAINRLRILNRQFLGSRLKNFRITVWEVDPGPHIKDNIDADYCTCLHYPGILPSGGMQDLACTTICQVTNYSITLGKRGMPMLAFGNIYSTTYRIHCAVQCQKNNLCLGFNFRLSGGADNCEIITSAVHPIIGVEDRPGWILAILQNLKISDT